MRHDRDGVYGEQRGAGAASEQAEISTPGDAANDALVPAFGRLKGAVNRLEYILGGL